MEFEEARDIMARHKHNVENGHGKIASLATDRKKLSFRTFLYRKESPNDETPETYEIRYFDTAIITLKHDKVELHDGGFFSTSTHARLNEFMPKGFRVHGATAQWYGHPVGFISTPAGTYPYNMPGSFKYDGTDGEHGTPQSGATFHKVPAYVDAYIAKLFNAELSPPWLAAVSDELGSYITRLINSNWFPEDLIFDAVDGSDLVGYGSVDVKNVVQILAKSGADVFRKATTKKTIAARTEAVFLHNMNIPTINLQLLRADFRHALIRYLVADLGFVDLTWNRRDQ